MTLYEIRKALGLRYGQAIRELKILLRRGHVKAVKIRGRTYYIVREDQIPVRQLDTLGAVSWGLVLLTIVVIAILVIATLHDLGLF